ncbi:NADH-quinone oxidoreductase subunit C [bacterium]|nr:NADH-quinone oxidoreductase subunit C [bacterium]
MDIQEFLAVFDGSEIIGEKIVIKNELHEVLKYVSEKYTYTMLKDIAAVDKGENGTELIYHLYSQSNEEDLQISIFVKDEAESVIDLFKSAIADENEIYDMFGIKFIGNDRLKRLYMPEGWEGHPLRKDYTEKDSRLAWNDYNNA